MLPLGDDVEAARRLPEPTSVDNFRGFTLWSGTAVTNVPRVIAGWPEPRLLGR
jgi:hypothetical protein